MSTINLVRADNNVNLISPVVNNMFAFLTGVFHIGASGFDTPIQIPFSNNFNSPSDAVQATINGDVIFNQIGVYSIEREHVLGRFGALDEAYVFGYTEKLGVVPSYADTYQIATDDEQWVRYSSTEIVSITSVPATYKYWLWCGSQGSPNGNDAYLLGITPNFPGGVNSPCFQINVKKLRSL